jgi:hypothetical protein
VPRTRLIFFKEEDGSAPVLEYCILYFFHGRNVAILGHALTKEDAIPPVDIERALKRKRLFERNPKAHTYEQEDGSK